MNCCLPRTHFARCRRYNKFVGSFGPRRLWLELDITFADGSSHSVQSAPGSGIQWKVKPSPGPVVFTHIYGGEDYDARLEAGVQGWDTPGFNDSSWVSAHPDAGPGCALSPQTVPARKVMASFDVVGVTEPQPGVFVYDMGQNVAGWMSIVVSGPAGSRVVVYPGEVVNSPGNGLVNQSTMGANPSTPNFFSYVLRGRGNETWHPVRSSGVRVRAIVLTTWCTRTEVFLSWHAILASHGSCTARISCW